MVKHSGRCSGGPLNARDRSNVVQRSDALDALDALVAEIQQQADRIAWLEGDVAGWRIKLADAEAEIKQLRDGHRHIAELTGTWQQIAVPRL
jgi:hypothetical protein